MITVHHLNHSRSQRVLWLLEELELQYEIKYYQRDPITLLAPAELRQVHPLGKSPVITDGALTLAESGAIIEYLIDRYGAGRLMPPMHTPEHLHYIYWLHYAEGSMMPWLLMLLAFERVGSQPMPFFARPIARLIAARARSGFIQPQIERHLSYLESQLQNNIWFVGNEFTAADIQLSFPIQAAAARAGLDVRRPQLLGFLDRIQARPAYQRALQRGGSYQLSH